MNVFVQFLEGLGGDWTSQGVLAMAHRIGTFGPQFTTNVLNWDKWEIAAQQLSKLPLGTRRLLVGYSNGGSRATSLAATGLMLDCVIGMDPTIWLPVYPLKANVAKAICLWNVNPLSSIPPVGHARYSLAAGNLKTKLTTVRVTNFHGNVDLDPANQNIVFNEAKALAA